MSLLDDFKTVIGVTGTSNDQYYIDYYLKTAIDRASVLSTNYKQTVVTMVSGTQSYDLTTEASPSVGSAGIQDLVLDGSYDLPLEYKRQWYIQGLTTLYIVDADDTYSGTMEFKYNEFYSKPTIDPTETNMPARLFPAVLKYAQGLYELDSLVSGGVSGGIKRKKEADLEIDYGSVDSRQQMIVDSMKLAEQMMIQNGASSILNFASMQVI